MMKQLFSGKVLLAAGILAALLSCATLAYILIFRPAAQGANPDPAAAALTVIPAPSSTSRPLPATLTSLPPTPTLPSTAVAGEFGLGAYVQVNADALNIRSEPGLNAPPLFLAFDAEVFHITDGPRQADGYTWWYLAASYDAARSGWAAQDFLMVIPSP